ncbi:hypothetical protein B0G77_0354 [Paraburkholderia sp. BL10I2N1]|nr:hypothetical protein B0G77_0354 [Paraburkholderia sp. BL10I2N1]
MLPIAALHAIVSYRQESGPAPMLTEWLERVDSACSTSL